MDSRRERRVKRRETERERVKMANMADCHVGQRSDRSERPVMTFSVTKVDTKYYVQADAEVV